MKGPVPAFQTKRFNVYELSVRASPENEPRLMFAAFFRRDDWPVPTDREMRRAVAADIRRKERRRTPTNARPLVLMFAGQVMARFAYAKYASEATGIEVGTIRECARVRGSTSDARYFRYEGDAREGEIRKSVPVVRLGDGRRFESIKAVVLAHVPPEIAADRKAVHREWERLWRSIRENGIYRGEKFKLAKDMQP